VDIKYGQRLDQFDYEMLGVHQYWYISKTAMMFTSFEMEAKGYFDRHDACDVYKKLYTKYETYVMNVITNCAYDVNTPSNPLAESYLEKGQQLIDSQTTTFTRIDFIKDVKKNNELKIDIEKLNRYLSGDESIPELKSQDPGELRQVTTSNDGVDDMKREPVDELIYPRYKGLKFIELTEETFEEIKKYYGMLQVEEAKSRKAIQIATNIGLLFYEKGLDIPATSPEFLEAYKKQFAGIPMRLVKLIQESLPDKYVSFAGANSKDSEGIDDDTLDAIIEASIAAGLLCRQDEIKDAKDLEQKLTRSGFEKPPQQFLKAISGACKRVLKKQKAEQV